MAFITRPPASTASNNSLRTSVVARIGRQFPIPAITGDAPAVAESEPLRSGAQIVAAGQYETTFNFNLLTTEDSTEIWVRGRAEGADGIKTPVKFCALTAGDCIEGSYSFFSNVTAFDVLANEVLILIEVASVADFETITWVHSQVNIQRIGPAK